EDDIYQLIM
nr:Chain L, Human metapneumovirus P C-terminal region [Human metapneumovirus A]8PDR_M Chain M, Human metapneumovirus P C-terminal region [Human metapneumovirus A]8PDR_N Chain N, Human metapneumovirus P C-terminal region [Human metapneumovirus A]8PDR_O Chain O, Human metapneumovirus P C-terminal region [Human metapneumovirus A]8PDR_P Chain P, Human metapneumovirus P C-terminal region [Human metapneumovirus A]8PDR_Q Chain Q, Human metapneumovirus P C-terminal region [Human metapneumovirus A]8PD